MHVIGHRGWPARYPDNSLPGLLAASRVCDAVEVDVRRSSDGLLVLSHDECIGNLEVASNDWESLGEVDIGGGVRPMLLEEAISSLPGTPLFIEIKNVPGFPGFEPDHRIALEAASKARPTDVVISFNWMSMDRVRNRFPDTPTGLNVGRTGDLTEAVAKCREDGHDYLVVDVDLLLGSAPVGLEEVSVLVWSTNKVETFGEVIPELVGRGVSGIIADDPLTTRRLLRSPDDHQG
ncbi:MAG: glycerophosphodiester phosphodiesterase [Actinobacteria bacterium]|nr:MAG: glycerophosphodiester phosphodiesterase [Actinomycetota bacterium]